MGESVGLRKDSEKFLKIVLEKEKKMGVILSLVHWTYLMKFQTLNLMLEI